MKKRFLVIDRESNAGRWRQFRWLSGLARLAHRELSAMSSFMNIRIFLFGRIFHDLLFLKIQHPETGISGSLREV